MSTPLARTLPAMTAVQALVAMGAFALSVLAPQLGIDVQRLGWLGSLMFAIGALASLRSGRLIRRFGDLQVAGLCMLAVALAMLCLAGGAIGVASDWTPLTPWAAVALIGLAFGPETAASASVLSRVTPIARRPLVFSIRQTGNQIGAMAGSLLLPLLLVTHVALPFVLLGALASGVALWCFRLGRRDGQRDEVRSAAAADGLRLLMGSAPLRRLAVATLVYSAVQVCLNFFVMSHGVLRWGLPVASAAGWVALMQAAGLVGRLLWGWAAQREGVASTRLLGGLGLLMSGCGIALFLWPTAPPAIVLALLLMLVGLSASGWNGVMVAEISRVAGAEASGAVTGAVLMFGYSGLALAPLAFAAISGMAGTATAFGLLFAVAGVIGFGLLRPAR
jgi:sugar phosphate permease